VVLWLVVLVQEVPVYVVLMPEGTMKPRTNPHLLPHQQPLKGETDQMERFLSWIMLAQQGKGKLYKTPFPTLKYPFCEDFEGVSPLHHHTSTSPRIITRQRESS